jgi:hypothetical protein
MPTNELNRAKDERNRTKFNLTVSGMISLFGFFMAIVVRNALEGVSKLGSLNIGLLALYAFYFLFLILLIQYFFGGIESLCHAHLFTRIEAPEEFTFKHLLLFQVDLFFQCIEFCCFYFLTTKVGDVGHAFLNLVVIFSIDGVWSLYAVFRDFYFHKKRPQAHTVYWFLKYLISSIVLLVLYWKGFVSWILLDLLLTLSIIAELVISWRYHRPGQ